MPSRTPVTICRSCVSIEKQNFHSRTGIAGRNRWHQSLPWNFPNHFGGRCRQKFTRCRQRRCRRNGTEGALPDFADGGGDRMGLVTRNICIGGSGIALARARASQASPRKARYFTVSNSGTLETEVAKWGGKPLMSKVGHSVCRTCDARKRRTVWRRNSPVFGLLRRRLFRFR